VFSAPEGVQTEVEVAAVEPAAAAPLSGTFGGWRGGSCSSGRRASPVIPTSTAGPLWFCGSASIPAVGRACCLPIWPPPATAARRSEAELAALALETLGG
jgi:hypothetical protein